MIVTILGSGTSVPQRARSAPGSLVRVGKRCLLVDAGTGVIWNLLRFAGIGLDRLGGVLLTHLHIDHCADLAPMLFALRSVELPRSAPLLVAGPEGTENYYKSLHGLYGRWVEPADYELSVKDLRGEVLRWEGFEIRSARTEHSLENIAYRITDEESGRNCLFTGDGQPTESLIAMAGGEVDILIAECAVPPEDTEMGHMNPAQAGALASDCGARLLVLNHLNPGCQREAVASEAARYFSGKILVAEDGMSVSLESVESGG
ncbi:MAG: MBL fold metallo-hydrolase [bacterium]|nr:MAG: MBL fold metallo-hydrolase [bacterium]